MTRSPAVSLAPNVWRIPTVGRSAVNSYDIAAFTHGPELTDRPRERIRHFLTRHR